MRYVLTLLYAILVFTSCQKTSPNITALEGTYVGTFQRITSSGGQLSNVTITFSEKNWTGQSQFAKYPALCNGTFTVSGSDKIVFENACPWTAEFDWTLILSQEYTLNKDGNNLEMWRDYGNARKDVYKLTKQ